MSGASAYDFIIVGAGSAGCVAANRLVQRFGCRVLLLEAGPDKRHILASIPAGTVKMWQGKTGYVHRFFSESQPGLDGRRVPLEVGAVIGGSSTVNMAAYARGSRFDYERWNEAVGGGWGWDDLLPYFRRQEGNQSFDNAIHGGDGPLKVSNARHRVRTTDLFVRTMQRAGVPFKADLSDGELPGVGYVQCTLDEGRRCSAAEAFLDPVRGNPRLHVVTQARVTRVLLEDGRATGVEYLLNGERRSASASREVLLAAGAYVSPKLLMLSGIGPSEELARHGIAVRVDLPGVGRNLQDHFYVPIAASMPAGYGYFGEDGGPKMLVNALRYLLFKEGPASSSGAETMAFARLDESDPDATLQIYCLAVMSPAVPPAHRSHGVTLCACMLNPHARGSISLRSADPADDPVIDLGWLTDQRDSEFLLRAVRHVRSLFRHPPLSEVVGGEVLPGAAVQSDADLLQFVKRALVSNHHPAGSCRMGRDDDPMAVLDGELRVRGARGLRVIDASMMPSLIRANCNSTVMAVAERAVDLIIGKNQAGEAARNPF